MRHKKLLLAVSMLVLSMLACATLFGEEYAEDEYSDESEATEEAAYSPEQAAHDAVCTPITDEIMFIVTNSAGGSEENPSDEEPITLVTYLISGDEISDPQFEDVSADLQDEQEDETTHAQVWQYFSALIPAADRHALVEYAIMTDGKDNTLAAVSQTQNSADEWSLQVDIADTANYYDLTYTLVHEYGHLLTLGPEQVTPSIALFNNPEDNDIYLREVSACPDYFPGEGCAAPDSYINAFYNQFWNDIHDEWNEINLIEDSDEYYEQLDAFYSKYEDRFVTDYAATNPEEDIAEAFAFFVLGPRPAGDTMAEEKILFFYDYPELVQLRSNILENLCTAFPG